MVILKKRILFLCTAFILVTSFIWLDKSYAAEKTYDIGVDAVDVRDDAAADANVVGQLKKGDQVTVFKEAHGWAQTYYDGDIAWVAAHYLIPADNSTKKVEKKKKQSKASSSNGKTVQVTEDIVNIRANASTHDEVVYIAEKGESFPLIETVNEWHKIKLPDGSTAWVASWVTTSKATGQAKSSSNSSSKKSTKKSSSKQTTSATPNVSLDGKNIMLDAGHGGKDPGAIAADGKYEKDMTLALTNKIAEKLRAHGATVTLVRTSDKTMSLNERIAFNKLFWTDAYISVHFNAFTKSGSRGISTHYYANKKDEQLAYSIQQALVQHTSLNDRGVQKDNYFVLRENADVSVLVELGFISNPDELSVIQSDAYDENVSNAVLEGLGNYFY